MVVGGLVVVVGGAVEVVVGGRVVGGVVVVEGGGDAGFVVGTVTVDTTGDVDVAAGGSVLVVGISTTEAVHPANKTQMTVLLNARMILVGAGVRGPASEAFILVQVWHPFGYPTT